MFERSRQLLEQYYCRMLRQGMSKRAEHLLHELRGRLRAVQWLHARLLELDRELEREARTELPAGSPTPGVLKLIFTDAETPDCQSYRHATLPFTRSDELRLLLETFYYSAHRIADVLHNSAADLPGLAKFKALGVRTVRNQLVEHPDQKGGVLVFSFATGGPVGPQLKPLRWSLAPPGTIDAGLHANAAEFEKALEAVLEQALAGS